MMSVRVISLLLIVNSMVLAQSSPVTLNHEALAPFGSKGVLQPDPAIRNSIVESYGKLPLSFEANQGQTDARVQFLSRGAGYTLFLTSDEAVFSLRGSETISHAQGFPGQLRRSAAVPAANAVLRMRLRNARPATRVAGVDELPGESNYFIGNEPKRWHSNVPTYAKVKYKGIYSGVDLVYYGNQRQLEYDFVVAPGADPRRIQFDVNGATRIDRDEGGDLVLQTKVGEVRWGKPIVYQEKDGARQEIAAHYVIGHKNRVGFEVADYDLRRPLFIDPLVYSTYLGGSGDDFGYGIAVDSSGDAYVIGQTNSTDFPTMNPLQPSSAGNYDAFVAKLNPTGSALVYSTYLGGSDYETGQGIAVDSSGNAYVTGQTQSTDFPTMNPLQPTYGGVVDAFVAKLNPTGSALIYSTYLGGSDDDRGCDIAVDSSGDACVAGSTQSNNFPTASALQPVYGGSIDAFVTKLNPAGSALVYSTYLGGSGIDYGFRIALDGSGTAYITGFTASTNFPTVNALQPTYGGGVEDAFVTSINASGSALVYSTYLGGSGDDVGFGIAVDSSGNAYLTGYTGSTNFPTMSPFQPTYGGGIYDAFVTKVNATGSSLVYSTYLGGSDTDYCYGVAVDSAGNAYLAGETNSTNFPIVNAFQPVYGGGFDAVVVEITPSGSALVYSTYLGGSSFDYAQSIAVDSLGNAYVTGSTSSTNFPTMNPLQPAYGGGTYDTFVTEIARAVPAVTLVPTNLNFGNQTVGITSTPQSVTLTNSGQLPLTITSISVTGLNSGDFAGTNTCGASVPVGGSCTITVTFTPATTGTRTASVSIMDNAPNSPQSLPLTGVGVLPAVTLAPPSLTFPDQTVFTTSKAKTVTLTNSGAGILTITSIAATGPFAQTNTCGTTVNPGASCTISVVFKPTTIGPATGSVSITDNAPGSPQQVKLKGTGTYIQLTPATVIFGTQPVGTTSLPKRITLTNKGSVAVNITNIAITGTNASDFAQTNTCGTGVAAGASCFIKVTFTPSAKGKRTAQVSISDDGGGSPQKVSLTGTGT
jgi:hypothetical protein